MSFTYGELKQALQDYTENDETTFVNNLPLFIRLTEERILKSVQLNLFQKNQFGNMTSGNEYLAAPSDFLAPFSLSIDVDGDKEFLLFKDLDFVQSFNPDATTTGQPRYYAQFDVDNFIIAPTPDASYTVDIHYLYRPVSLTSGADSGTSWLSENAEITLLYGALIEAYTFMKGDPNLMQMYNQRYGEGISRLKNLGEAQETTDEYRYGAVRKPRT
mgnify:CR=1 FL=1|tara:strand:+ start:996 stop:1643 length:648 start_codon:yes stop_codon:yes gene_type:complete